MNTRKKVIKTVFKDDNDSEEETGDFSDSGSEAKITEQSSSEDEEDEHIASSGDEFKNVHKNVKNMPLRSKQAIKQVPRKPKFAKLFVNKISKQVSIEDEGENSSSYISLKDLTEADKLLPSVLNLSESDSSDDESPKTFDKKSSAKSNISHNQDDDSENETKTEFRDVWSHNILESELSEEIARKAFLELEQHKSELEQTKATLTNYTTKVKPENEFDVNDLLAQGEDLVLQKKTQAKQNRRKKAKDDSDSEMEDWEEVQESKPIPKQGLQLIVEVPDLVRRKTKTIDVEMMMKRKLNRVKKEYQIYMHKVHVLCWLGHGNYVSQILNEQEILAATLSLVPGKECYPGERVDLKYIEQITTWYKDKLTFKLDKNENKFRPKAPPLKEILLAQIKSRVVTAKKYLVFIFVAMLRALGLQCRIMFNFVTLPIKPPTSELCSLSTKATDKKDDKQKSKTIKEKQLTETKTTEKVSKSKINEEISQVDGTDDSMYIENIMQLDGNNDILPAQTRSTRARKAKSSNAVTAEEDVSPPKRPKKTSSSKPNKSTSETETRNAQGPKPSTEKGLEKNTSAPQEIKTITKTKRSVRIKKILSEEKEPPHIDTSKLKEENLKTTEKSNIKKTASPRKTRGGNKNPAHINKSSKSDLQQKTSNKKANLEAPKIVVTKTDQNLKVHLSKYFDNEGNSDGDETRVSRKRSKTVNPSNTQTSKDKDKQEPIKGRTKSAPGSAEKSKYFAPEDTASSPTKKIRLSLKSNKAESKAEDHQRVSHRDLVKSRAKPKNDVTADLVNIIKGRVKEAKEESQKGIVKGKIKQESDEDSDFLPEEDIRVKSESDDDFKPSIISPRPGTSKQVRKKKDRRVISTDDDTLTSTVKVDVWCEVFVEELEQWISVNVIKGKVHCAENIYSGASHPVCYMVGWDNNNYLKDLTRRYVPHWNTVTRKQRAEPAWWDTALRPWLGPRNARDREEDEQLDRMQLDAPLPKSIGEYKNHPLYALKRHLLKFEAIYPPDAATLGFVRGEAVYARECVYTCQSRDKWLKDAKVVRLGEKPFKVVKARPKWDRLSNKLITDKPLEVFGPWQVQDYEPPTAEGGIVPRNAYGNVELFKPCMLPKGTVHIKLPGLNRVAKKLNIDCAPAMTGFDFNGGWSHPVYDGFVVCKEFEEIITEAWVEDQEILERKEQEKTEARVYGNWRRLIKGLLIRERLKNKYGFEEPSTSQDKKKSKGPRLVVTKRKS